MPSYFQSEGFCWSGVYEVDGDEDLVGRLAIASASKAKYKVFGPVTSVQFWGAEAVLCAEAERRTYVLQ